jgi:hypothetical protein
MMRLMVIAILISVIAVAVPAGAQMYLELGAPPIREPIPPNGSQWHELFPQFCNVRVQESYEDNGDGEVSVCDIIVVDGIRYHVDWAGPTYYMVDTGSGEPKFCEPTIPDPGGDPTGEIWHEVAPVFCTEWVVDEWLDNGNGILDECDMVAVGGRIWHIEEVRLDITVTEEASAVEPSTWSRVKDLLGRLF